MVFNSRQASAKRLKKRLEALRGSPPLPPPPPPPPNKLVAASSLSRQQCFHFSQRLKPDSYVILNAIANVQSGADEVINLGAPRRRRRDVPPRASNPVSTRLYPGPKRSSGKGKAKSVTTRAPSEGQTKRGGQGVRRRRKRYYKLPVPNSRLYRPPQVPPRSLSPAQLPQRLQSSTRLWLPSQRPRSQPTSALTQSRPPLTRRYHGAWPAPPSPPPRRPYAVWPKPAPPQLLETASGAALRLAARRRGPGAAAASDPPLAHQAVEVDRTVQAVHSVWASRTLQDRRSAGRQFVVTLPSAQAAARLERKSGQPRSQPTYAHFRLQSLNTDSSSTSTEPTTAPSPMERCSASPEYSDANDTLSAPSEYLAEFLSAIMKRHYAEALKYCRLILQYEPHNATARGFYPLLLHKLGRNCRSDMTAHCATPPSAGEPHPHPQEVMQEDADTASEESASGAWTASAGSADSCASLSMDSSGTHSSRGAARAGDASPVARSPSVSGGASSASECWEYSRGSGGSARAASRPPSRPPSRPSSRLDRDDNGNPQPQHLRPVCSGDVENDNAAGGDHTPLVKSATASLQQLRAQFTASAQ